MSEATQKNVPVLKNLWDLWLTGYWGKGKHPLSMIMEMILLASQSPEGKLLFIKALEDIKQDYPAMAEELWDAYDDWNNIHKTDYFRLSD